MEACRTLEDGKGVAANFWRPLRGLGNLTEKIHHAIPRPTIPRTARASEANLCYHVLNRGNARSVVFHKEDDYAAFLAAMAEASVRLPMRVVAYCLMPNHYHLVIRPHADGDLGRWMHWLSTTHVRR